MLLEFVGCDEVSLTGGFGSALWKQGTSEREVVLQEAAIPLRIDVSLLAVASLRAEGR